ncbi:MAG: hypothetical protein AAFX62_18455, partial [Pseudomonadota bacterium]
PALFLGTGMATGLGGLGAGLAIRLWSALRHLLSGLKALPSNWRRLMLVNDPYQPPELVPRITDLDRAPSFGRMLDNARSEKGLKRWIAYVNLATWAVPAWAWRFSIKSTAWVYFPFFYIVRIPPAYKDRPGRTQLVTVRGTTRWDWAGALLVFGVLAGSAATLVVPELVQDLIGQRDPNRPLTPLHYILVIDWGALRLYHAFLLPALMITVFLFFYMDELRKWSVNPMGWKVMAAITLMNLGWVLVMVYVPLMIEAFTYDVYMRFALAAGAAGGGLWPGGMRATLAKAGAVGYLARHDGHGSLRTGGAGDRRIARLWRGGGCSDGGRGRASLGAGAHHGRARGAG